MPPRPAPLSLLAILFGLHAAPVAALPRSATSPAAAAPRDQGASLHGRLPNGLRYAVLPRRETGETGVGMVMRVEGGFIDERRPGERGATHLIEHLVFVSPTTAAPDEPRRFGRVGLPLSWPAPTAATTEWRDTNYFLSTRTWREANLDTLLGLFREVASGLVFKLDIVDEQRADVMREMAGRKAGNIAYAEFIRATGPGSPADAIDGQNHDDVPGIGIDALRALYGRLYRPDKVMILIVGNIDPARAARLIARRFGDWKAAAPAPRVPTTTLDVGRIAAISYSAAPQTRGVALLSVASPSLPPAPTRTAQAAAALMEMLATRAVNNRLAAASPGSPPGAVGVLFRGDNGHRQLHAWRDFEPGGWQAAVAALNRTTCGLAAAGFSEAEWAAAKQDLFDDLDRRVSARWQVANVEVARDMARALADGRELLRRRNRSAARAYLPAVTATAGSEWWRLEWRAGPLHLRVEGPELAQINDPFRAIRETADASTDGACRIWD